MLTKENIVEFLRPILAASGSELVDLSVTRGHHLVQIRIFVDREGGVSVEDCAELSRQIARRLDAGPAAGVEYRLEVSSPGMNRPVWSLAHFRRFRGERLHFELREPRDGRVRFGGRIEAVTDDHVQLRTDEGELFEVREEDLVSARLDLDPWKRGH